jgi:Flp pilus assembly protein TadD
LVMPDQPGEEVPLPVAEDEQVEVKPAQTLPEVNPSADGGEPVVPPKTTQPRHRLRAAIRAIYQPSSTETAPEFEPEEIPFYRADETPGQPPNLSQPEPEAPAPPEQPPNLILEDETPVSPEEPPVLLQEGITLPPDETIQAEQPPAPIGEEAAVLPEQPAAPALEQAKEPIAAVSDNPAEQVEESTQPSLDQTELERAARAQALIAKGQAQARQGQLEQARKLFGQAVQQDPANAEAWTWLGGLLTDLNLERAKVCLTRAVELDPTNERANRGLAQVNSRLEAAGILIGETEVAGENNRRVHPSRAIVLVRPEIKIGLEEIIDKQRQSGLEPDPESIPLGGARLRPAIEKGQLKPYRLGRTRLGPLTVILGLGTLICIMAALIWLGPFGKTNSETPVTANSAPGGLNGPAVPTAALSADETFALGIRVEIDRYNKFFLTAHDLRQQVQKGKISWEDYQHASKQLQTDVKNEKKPLDNLALATTPKLIQYYRELQNIATVSNQAIDFTNSGIENTSPEDLEEGNRQFNEAARRLTELLRLLNQQVPLATPLPGATPGPAT